MIIIIIKKQKLLILFNNNKNNNYYKINMIITSSSLCSSYTALIKLATGGIIPLTNKKMASSGWSLSLFLYIYK